MPDARTRRFRAALDILWASRAHRVLGPLTRGQGVVFTLHHVRPWSGAAFAPNRLLEITPNFLETVLHYLRGADYDIVSLDEAVARLGNRDAKRFASFTFDDGFRDVRDHALPVMRRYDAPSMLFVTTAFADGTGDLWWIALERAIAASTALEFGGEKIDASSAEKKYTAWNRLYWTLRGMGEPEMRAEIARLAERAGVDMRGAARDLCMNWNELREVVKDPLVSIGNHTVNHVMLAKHPAKRALDEMADTQARIAAELNVIPKHVAYPVGDPTSAGQREFGFARRLGLNGWTTRLGVLFPEHAKHKAALPRVSLNGHYQKRKYVELFVSGLPFAVNQRFRRLNVG